MKKVKYYALCSKGIEVTKRHLQTIKKEDLCIVINTLDNEYRKAAVTMCKENGVEFYVTESDGTAATGKNSVLDIFESSDNDYAVMIDGDDFLTAHGVNMYFSIAQILDIDVLALENQYGLDPHPVILHQYDERTFTGFKDCDPNNIPPVGTRPMVRAEFFFGDYIKKYSADIFKWTTFTRKYISPNELHLRVVMISKKAAKGIRYDNTYKIGEDTLLYLEYKYRHSIGELKMRHLYDTIPTYVYDRRTAGVSIEEYINSTIVGSTQKWLVDLLVAFENIEKQGRVSEEEIPKITYGTDKSDEIQFPEDYRPDALALPNLYINVHDFLPQKNSIV